MTGIKPRRIVQDIQIVPNEPAVTLEITRAHKQKIMNIEKPQTNMENIHKKVEKRKAERLERSIREHNHATNFSEPNLQISDLVLVRIEDKVGHKK